jgi:hypothetical protein
LGASISIVSQGNNRRRNIQLLSYIAPLVMYTTRLLAPVGCLQYITYCYNTTGFIHFFFSFFQVDVGGGGIPSTGSSSVHLVERGERERKAGHINSQWCNHASTLEWRTVATTGQNNQVRPVLQATPYDGQKRNRNDIIYTRGGYYVI